MLLISCVLSYWFASEAMLCRIAEMGYPRITMFLGHEDWLDERGMFALSVREKWLWGVMLAVLAGHKLIAASRTPCRQFKEDTICAVAGMVLGVILVFAGHSFIYGSDLIFSGESVRTVLVWSMAGFVGGMFVVVLERFSK